LVPHSSTLVEEEEFKKCFQQLQGKLSRKLSLQNVAEK
jgi:hypothetical protein